MLQEHETIKLGQVKGQGHRRSKLYLEAWRRRHSRSSWVE